MYWRILVFRMPWNGMGFVELANLSQSDLHGNQGKPQSSMHGRFWVSKSYGRWWSGMSDTTVVAKDVVRFIIIYRTTLHSLECHTCDSANNEIQSYNHYYSWTKVTWSVGMDQSTWYHYRGSSLEPCFDFLHLIGFKQVQKSGRQLFSAPKKSGRFYVGRHRQGEE